MSLVVVENLEKTFNDGDLSTTVLKGLNFTIEAGEFVSIMGPSGSGKSTLLHILGFLSEPTTGSYQFNGKRFEDHTEDEVAHIRNNEIGFVFQAFNLLPRQTVYENVKLPLMYSGRPESEWKKRVEDVIAIVGLEHRMNYETNKLSGGEKQRTAIARALVNGPRLIFADEPTGNLDSKTGQAVMHTLQHLHDTFGHTIVLITHETYTAEHADRMIKLVDGMIASDEPIKNRRNADVNFTK